MRFGRSPPCRRAPLGASRNHNSAVQAEDVVIAIRREQAYAQDLGKGGFLQKRHKEIRTALDVADLHMTVQAFASNCRTPRRPLADAAETNCWNYRERAQAIAIPGSALPRLSPRLHAASPESALKRSSFQAPGCRPQAQTAQETGYRLYGLPFHDLSRGVIHLIPLLTSRMLVVMSHQKLTHRGGDLFEMRLKCEVAGR